MTASIKARMAAGALAFAMVPQTAFAQSDRNESEEAKTIPSSFRLTAGVSYSSGEYGDLTDTEVIAVPIGATWRRGDLKLRVSVPWVHIDGPGSLLQTPEGRDNGGGGGRTDNSGPGSANSGRGGGGNSGSGGGELEVEDSSDVVDDDGSTDDDGFAGANDRRSGIGDVVVAATYSFELGETTWFEPGVKIKLPTASRTKRLGTGELDVTVGADLVQEFGPATVYVGGRRKLAGKPEGSTIRSTWGVGGGLSLSASATVTMGADYDWQQSAFVGRQASSEVSGWVNARLSKRMSITVYAGTGLNANSADVFGGASISLRM